MRIGSPSNHCVSATPILRQISPTDVPDSACLKANAICSSENRFFGIWVPLSFQRKYPKIRAKNGLIYRVKTHHAINDFEGGLLFGGLPVLAAGTRMSGAETAWPWAFCTAWEGHRMGVSQTTRRVAALSLLGGGLVASLAFWIRPQSLRPAQIVATRNGKLRGLRSGGVSAFLGIAYGGDTARHRFQPAPPPEPWRGTKDCFAFGPDAPQGKGGSEDCLVLNVFTPAATASAHGRPVMVWLHGGGFNTGSGSNPLYNGRALCRAGDVVVVTLNHRLGVFGYLYLGALNDEFSDSGNMGQLDIILALQWVRDNIASFGGDPDNVTIFGESGGGQKVSTLLTMPPAQGLFHKAVMQSAPGVAMASKTDAAALAERLLTALGLAHTDLPRLQTMDFRRLLDAAPLVQQASGGAFEPVVDGVSLPENPFTPFAPDISRSIPLMIGTNRDEASLALVREPGFAAMTVEEASARFTAIAGARAADAFALYRGLRPNDLPGYWVVALITDKRFLAPAISVAEMKAAQNAAAVYMYRLDWRTPVEDGMLRTPHALDLPLVFNNVNVARAMVGPGRQPQSMADIMSRAWINFAHTGNPSQDGIAWPAYDATMRQTMIFDLPSAAEPDPDSAVRRFWNQ
jgi:para-nitrobenzyl esterase